MDKEYVVEVKDLKKYFPIKAGLLQRTVGHVRVVDGVSFNIQKGQTFGLVGESGCGKTTIGRSMLRLTEPTSGQVRINGEDICSKKRKELRPLRPKMQMIFQDPFSSLDPRMPVGEIIGEAVREHNIVSKDEYKDYVLEIMKECGLRPYYIDR